MMQDDATEQLLESGTATVEFDSHEEAALFRLADLGEDARDFFQSDLGQYVQGAAIQDQERIARELVTVSPWRRKKIIRLQNQHQAVANGIRWLGEVVRLGNEAMRELEARRFRD